MKRELGWSCWGCAVGLILACSSTSNDGDDSAGAGGSDASSAGGSSSASGGASSGGADASGGASSGGASSGGADASGGSSSGGADASGGASSGGADASGGASGGADASGGASGGGASATGACAPSEFGTSVAAGTCALINDFEGDAGEFGAGFELDADGRQGAGIDVISPGEARLTGGKNGSGSGSLEVVDDGDNAFLRFTFDDAEDWGGTFAHMISNAACYDASVYGGVRFLARASDSEELQFAVVTADSAPLYDCAPVLECYNHPTTTISVSSDWQEIEIAWNDLQRPNWGQGKNDEIDPARILAFIFGDAGDAADNDIRLDIDDIEFIGGDTSSCDFIDPGEEE